MPVAYCFRSGEVEIAASRKCVPEGAIPVISSRSISVLRDVVDVMARHSYDGKTLLVPGIPEASNDKAALEALRAWAQRMVGTSRITVLARF